MLLIYVREIAVPKRGFHVLYAKLSPELDAVETHEVGLSIASSEEQNDLAGKRGYDRVRPDRLRPRPS